MREIHVNTRINCDVQTNSDPLKLNVAYTNTVAGISVLSAAAVIGKGGGRALGHWSGCCGSQWTSYQQAICY